jgi:hypothetical protein
MQIQTHLLKTPSQKWQKNKFSNHSGFELGKALTVNSTPHPLLSRLESGKAVTVNSTPNPLLTTGIELASSTPGVTALNPMLKAVKP